ncbi:zinc-dependent metalloprotease [Actinomyces israelii]|uniref:zinc-dependent metalloprotease n=1 Tax=Actinomyces israelii TaxID=1659 RepID=UPI0005B83C7C|nr:zinc-dependent metalloprotease [Actinomyces israelii]
MSPSTVFAPTAADLVDWDAAVRLSRVVVPAGPRVPTSTRRATVALLRRSIAGALPWAGRITGMTDAARCAAETAEILVVDRAGLMTASAAWLRGLMGGVPAPNAGRGARTLATAEVGAALGCLSTRLLGQVLPPLDRGDDDGSCAGTGAAARPGARLRARTASAVGARRQPGARLLLVAPNVLEIRQRLELDVIDLPAWITLHEATHLIQLSTAPWLASYLADQLRAVVGGLVAAVRSAGAGGPDLYARLAQAVALARSADGRSPEPVALLLNSLLKAPERESLARLAALLTLLEGHAEAVLDAVDPNRMPSVHRLRAVLARRRRATGGVGPGPSSGSLLHHMIGVEAKEAQYADGAAFVRAVVARVGHAGLNTVWNAPDNLPLPDEIARPDQWIERFGL